MPVPQAIGSRYAPLGKNNVADRGETNPLDPAPVKQMDNDREGGSEQTVEVQRMQKEKGHRRR
jgi:hypothetical protein